MRTIRYVPVHGTAEPMSIDGVQLAPGVDVEVEDDAVAAKILQSRMFVDATTGKNPKFVCTGCGIETFQEAVFDPLLARLHGTAVRSLVATDGTRKCVPCDAKARIGVPAQAATSPSWTTKIASSIDD